MQRADEHTVKIRSKCNSHQNNNVKAMNIGIRGSLLILTTTILNPLYYIQSQPTQSTQKVQTEAIKVQVHYFVRRQYCKYKYSNTALPIHANPLSFSLSTSTDSLPSNNQSRANFILAERPKIKEYGGGQSFFSRQFFHSNPRIFLPSECGVRWGKMAPLRPGSTLLILIFHFFFAVQGIPDIIPPFFAPSPFPVFPESENQGDKETEKFGWQKIRLFLFTQKKG